MKIKNRNLSNQVEENFYLNSILKKIPGSIYWKNKDGVYLGCNDFVLKMAGTNEIVGKTDFDLPWKEYAEEIRKVDRQVMETNKQVELEEHPILADGQQIIMLTQKVPLKDEKGNIVGVLGMSIDITERKKLEADLKHAKEAAEAANRVKTEFLENMRHDMRTPLIGITGFASIIGNEVKDPKIKEYVENLTASSYALLDLLNEILEVIKVNSGDIPVLKRKFDLKKRLYDVIRLTQAKANHKNLDLIFDFDSAIPPYVIGDYTRIHRIVLELTANALNFTNVGRVKVTAQLAKSEGNDLIVKLIVEDTGIGIEPNKQQEIFLQFKRLTPSYAGIYKGAGLGLAIVKQFIDELEGEIYVESQIGKGTIFTCLLPFKKPLLDDEFGCDLTAIEYQRLETSKRAAIDEVLKQETFLAVSKILVVEDQDIAAIVVKKMLSDMDCQVTIAADGKTAIQLIKENHFDLIFMDVGLPDMDGYEVAKRIRVFELSKGTHVPIIALTAHVDEENKQRCIDVGMNAVLSKPLGKDKAEDILNGFIPYRKKRLENESKSMSEDSHYSEPLEGPIINIELIMKQLNCDESTAYGLLKLFITTFPNELEKLKDAFDKKDWITFQVVTLKLKGDSTYCAATRLEEVCSRIETAIKHTKINLVTDLYKQLRDEIKRFEEAVIKKNY